MPGGDEQVENRTRGFNRTRGSQSTVTVLLLLGERGGSKEHALVPHSSRGAEGEGERGV
jgi:hypothetical protein